MESSEDFPCNRCEGYFSEYFMDPVSIDNGLFVGGLSKRSKLATASMVSLIKRSSKLSQFCVGEPVARAGQPLLFGEAKVHKWRIFNGVKK
jgi:hypothetical protein